MRAIIIISRATLLSLFLTGSIDTFAQPGISEFYSASREFHRWYFSLSDLVLVIGSLAGILGGLRIYSNWQMGKHHIDAQIMGWFFSCLFLILIGAFLRGLFGL